MSQAQSLGLGGMGGMGGLGGLGGLGGMGGMGGLGNMGGLGGLGANTNFKELYKNQLEQLSGMGFTNENVNL